MTFKAVIFDIDGTLANTLPICVESYRDVLQRYMNRPFQTEEITRYFGMSEEGILGVYIAPERCAEAEVEYFKVYEEMHVVCREPFPGLKDAILRLREQGVPVAVVTGKGPRGAEVTLRVLGLTPHLSAVEAGFKEGPNKPESLRRVLAQLGLKAEEAFYVGDSASDVEDAASIRMPVIAAAWAETNTLTPETRAKATKVFDRIEDFTYWLDQTFPSGS